MTDDLAARARQLALALTACPSVTGTAGEAAMASRRFQIGPGLKHCADGKPYKPHACQGPAECRTLVEKTRSEDRIWPPA